MMPACILPLSLSGLYPRKVQQLLRCSYTRLLPLLLMVVCARLYGTPCRTPIEQ